MFMLTVNQHYASIWISVVTFHQMEFWWGGGLSDTVFEVYDIFENDCGLCSIWLDMKRPSISLTSSSSNAAIFIMNLHMNKPYNKLKTNAFLVSSPDVILFKIAPVFLQRVFPCSLFLFSTAHLVNPFSYLAFLVEHGVIATSQ